LCYSVIKWGSWGLCVVRKRCPALDFSISSRGRLPVGGLCGPRTGRKGVESLDERVCTSLSPSWAGRLVCRQAPACLVAGALCIKGGRVWLAARGGGGGEMVPCRQGTTLSIFANESCMASSRGPPIARLSSLASLPLSSVGIALLAYSHCHQAAVWVV
jgi:hypothetical protein